MANPIKQMVMQFIEPVQNRIMMAIARGVIESVNDSGGIQTIKSSFLAGENRDGVERFQNFGFTSNPPANSECVAVFVGGNREHGLIVALDDRASRLKGLAPGESAQYNASGDKWHLKANGNLEGALGGNLEVALTKLKFDNGSDELIDLMVQQLDALLAEPFIVNKATFAILKTKVEAFKV